MNHLRALLVLVLLTGALTACSGERFGATLLEEPTPEGRWRVGGTLIRSYDVSLEEAYQSVEQLAENEEWAISNSSSSPEEASLTATTEEGVQIHFSVWAPPGRATEIGIQYSNGDQIGSSRVFEKLEEVLPGERIDANRA